MKLISLEDYLAEGSNAEFQNLVNLATSPDSANRSIAALQMPNYSKRQKFYTDCRKIWEKIKDGAGVAAEVKTAVASVIDWLDGQTVDGISEHLEKTFEVATVKDGKLYSYIKDFNFLIKLNVNNGKFMFKFSKECEGDFDCSNIGLKSLVGCPEIVTGNFLCNKNELKTLTGGPAVVKKDYDCSDNQIRGLEGIAGEIGGKFKAMHNKINDLEKFPKVGGSVYLNGNQLSDLKGCPEKVNGTFNCSTMKTLKALTGAPKEITGSLLCHDTQITDMHGGPLSVGGHVDCADCKLQTLRGAPKTVGDGFNCKSNKLNSLEGAPLNVPGDFDCSNNPQLAGPEDGPTTVGGNYLCSRNRRSFNEKAVLRYCKVEGKIKDSPYE